MPLKLVGELERGTSLFSLGLRRSRGLCFGYPRLNLGDRDLYSLDLSCQDTTFLV